MGKLQHICFGISICLCFVTVAPLEVGRQGSKPVHEEFSGKHSHPFLPLISVSLDRWGGKTFHGADNFLNSRSQSLSNHTEGAASRISSHTGGSSQRVLIGSLIIWVIIAVCMLVNCGKPDAEKRQNKPQPATTVAPPKNMGERSDSLPTLQAIHETIPFIPAQQPVASQNFAYKPRDVSDEEAITLVVSCNMISKQEIDSNSVSQEHLTEWMLVARRMLQLKPLEDWQAQSLYQRQEFQDIVAAVFEAEAHDRARQIIPEPQQERKKVQAFAMNPQDVYVVQPSVQWLPAGAQSAPVGPYVQPSAQAPPRKDTLDSSISFGQVSFGKISSGNVSSGREEEELARQAMRMNQEEELLLARQALDQEEELLLARQAMQGNQQEELLPQVQQQRTAPNIPPIPNSARSQQSMPWNPAQNSARSYKSPVPQLNCYDQPGYDPQALPSSGEIGSDIVYSQDVILSASAPPQVIGSGQIVGSSQVLNSDQSISVNNDEGDAFPSVFSSSCPSQERFAPASAVSSAQASPMEPQRAPPTAPSMGPTGSMGSFSYSNQEVSNSGTPTRGGFKLQAHEVMTTAPRGWSSMPANFAQTSQRPHTPTSSMRLGAQEVMVPASEAAVSIAIAQGRSTPPSTNQ